jgi:hypothetical protein
VEPWVCCGSIGFQLFAENGSVYFNERRSNLSTSISENSRHLQDTLHGRVIMGRRSCTNRQWLDLSGMGDSGMFG